MHSLGIVICDFKVADIRAEAARMMAPFDSKIEVPKYIMKHSASEAACFMTARGVHTIDDLAIALQKDIYRDFFVQDGMLMSYSTRNPKGHWDYYGVGGLYHGRISDDESSMIGFERDWDKDVCRNVARPASIGRDYLPHIIVTPDGNWHDSFDHGWRNVAPDHEKNIAWQSWAAFALPLLSSYSRHIVLGLDIHS